MGPPPDNYLVWAILTTIFCCLPLGVVSIVKSSKVQGLWFSGQYAEAQRAAEEAKKFAIWSAIIGPIVVIAAWIALFVIGGIAATTSGY